MNPRRQILLLTCLIAVLLASNSGSIAAAPELVELARKRQNLPHDLVVEFSATSTQAGKTRGAAVEHTFTNKLHLKDQLLRYESDPPIHVALSGKFIQKRQVSIIREADALAFFPEGIGHSATPVGIRQNRENNNHLKSSELLPLVIYFRGLDKSLNDYALDALRPTGASVAIDGRHCREFEFKMAGDLIAKLYFDLAAGGILRRMTQTKAGQVVNRMEIRYRDRPGYGTFPQSWDYEKLDPDGKVTYSFSATTANVTAPARNDAKLFDLDFPPGTIVSDQLTKEEYTVGHEGAKVPHPIAPASAINWSKVSYLAVIAACMFGMIAVAVYSIRVRSPRTIRPAPKPFISRSIDWTFDCRDP